MASEVRTWYIFKQILAVTSSLPYSTCKLHFKTSTYFPSPLSNRHFFAITDLLMTAASITERFTSDPSSIFKLSMMISWNCKTPSEVCRCTLIWHLVGIKRRAWSSLFYRCRLLHFGSNKLPTHLLCAGEKRVTICEVGHEVTMQFYSEFPSFLANNYLALNIHVWVAFIGLTPKCHNS